jgi:hypothetical protein
MNIREMINPWSALTAARQEVGVLKATVARLEAAQKALLVELEDARKNDTRGKNGRYEKRK